MTLELAIILGFIFHLIGDYVTQNHWMAINKTKYNWVALLHANIYSAPFLLLFLLIPGDQKFAFCIILWTHFFIDRFRLAQYWIKLVNWNWNSDNHGFPNETPVWLSTWLLFIVDNIFHISINTATIILFYK
jgi:hypothetical protein